MRSGAVRPVQNTRVTASCAILTEVPARLKIDTAPRSDGKRSTFVCSGERVPPSILFALHLWQIALAERGAGRYAVMARGLLYRLVLSAALAGLAGCSSVSQRVEEQRPF